VSKQQPLRAAVSKIPVLILFAILSAARGQQPAPAPPQNPDQAPQAAGESPNDLLVTAGKSVIVTSAANIERVSVGFGDVAEATAITPHEVLVNGKTPGETSLIVWQQGGTKLFFDVTVRPSRFVANGRIDAIRRELRRELPSQSINLTYENDTVFLHGTVRDLTSAQRAESIASTLGKTVNLLYVDVPSTEAQILLKVKFASVDRSAGTELGLNLASTGATNTIGTGTTGQFAPPTVEHDARTGITTLTVSDALNIFLFRPDLNLAATIRALQRKSLLEVLAEPNVLAINGKQASFLAGGEFPFPTLQGGGAGLGQITIQFREFGVRLNFIPTITPRGTIRLQVAPEVSALDFANGLLVQGINVPALSVRKINTAVELQPGQSFALAGLLDNRLNETIQKIPLLGDLPWVGKIFQSKALNRNNTELLVIVTPELVSPIPAGQPLPALNYPKPFLPPNTGTEIRTPGMATTGPPATTHQPAIPIESLTQSMKTETPLNTSGQVLPVPGGNFFPVLVPTAPAPATPPAQQAPATAPVSK
jgi:pilus assembly protein CpaC